MIAQDQVAHVMSEREVMSKCNHPFLLRMCASYQDGDALYMLIELVPGGELFSLLRQQSYFQEPNPRSNPNPDPNPIPNPNPP